MGMISVPSNFALWINKEGHFGVMDTNRGEVWHPLDNDECHIKVQRLGLDEHLRPVFSITFVGALEVERVKASCGCTSSFQSGLCPDCYEKYAAMGGGGDGRSA